MNINMLIFLISFVGMAVFFHGRTKINIYFMPILVISLISISVIIGGCVGINLKIISGLLCVIGFGMFVASIILKYFNRKLITPGTIAFFVGIIGIFIYTYNRVFDNWDCFAHWGLFCSLGINCKADAD